MARGSLQTGEERLRTNLITLKCQPTPLCYSQFFFYRIQSLPEPVKNIQIRMCKPS